MKRVKVRLIGTGTRDDPFRVNLPTSIIDCKRDADGNPIWINEAEGIAESSIDWKTMTCYVLVPDDEVDEKGRLNEKRIREKYKEG